MPIGGAQLVAEGAPLEAEPCSALPCPAQAAADLVGESSPIAAGLALHWAPPCCDCLLLRVLVGEAKECGMTLSPPCTAPLLQAT